VIPSLEALQAAKLAAAAEEWGFIVKPGDPRLAVSTCAGMEGCGRGSTSTHRDADRIARTIPAGVSVHLSGCAKGCAHPAPADLTLVGDHGDYQVVLAGTARDKPVGRAGMDGILERLASFSGEKNLMRVFGTWQL
jgi:precorrin-3B synthase